MYKRQAPEAVESSGKTWREMLLDPRCYLLWATLLCASVAGLMLIGHASKIGQEEMCIRDRGWNDSFGTGCKMIVTDIKGHEFVYSAVGGDGPEEPDESDYFTTSISVAKNPDKMQYNQDEEFDPAGMVVEAEQKLSLIHISLKMRYPIARVRPLEFIRFFVLFPLT